MNEIDISTELCGIRLRNPTVLASGILGLSGDLLIRIARAGAGAVTAKSCGLEPRAGYRNPVVIDWGGGLINAVGLSNPGVEAMRRELLRAKEELVSLGVPLIASIFADTPEGFGQMAKEISLAEPDLIEVNISCPNVEAEFEEMFASSPTSAAQVTRQVKESTSIPIIVKLSPNVPDIALIAEAVEAAGADAISAINSLGPGMLIDIQSGFPILSNKMGGVSGPAIRPIAVRCVHDICSKVKIPVVGLGGVTTGQDLMEMVMAGAAVVGIGSAAHYRGIEVFQKVCQETRELMAEYGYRSLDEIRGKARDAAAFGAG